MKISIYNSLVPLTEKYNLLYNAYTNKYLVLPLHLTQIVKNTDLNEIQNNYSDFYDQLTDAGCLVEDEVDEAGLLKNRIQEIDNSTDRYRLIINPTINCNFKCWYCYEEHIPKSKMDSDVLARTQKHISKILSQEGLKAFDLSFFGGEPLLYFKDVVLPLIKYVNTDCHEKGIEFGIHFTTNGYLINDKMIEDMKTYKAGSFQITLDGCREQHDQVRFPYKGGNSYDKIISNIIKLVQNEFYVVLRINYTQNNLENVSEIAKDIESIPEEFKKYLSIDFQRVWQDIDSKDISEEEKLEKTLEHNVEIFSNLGLQVTYKSPEYVWGSCYADKKNEAVINYNGDVYKCTARDFKKENRVGYLSENGEIVWDEAKMKERCNIRFTKPICQSCRIAPLCGGACSQNHLESMKYNNCALKVDEKGKDKIVLDRFYNFFVR